MGHITFELKEDSTKCATLAAGPGPEANENLVGPVRN